MNASPNRYGLAVDRTSCAVPDLPAQRSFRHVTNQDQIDILVRQSCVSGDAESAAFTHPEEEMMTHARAND